MKTMQSKVLGMIIAEAEKRGFEAVQSPAYVNTGEIYIQQPDKLEVLVLITYQFNTGNTTLTLKHRDKWEVAARQKHRTDGYHDWYLENTNVQLIDEYFAALNMCLAIEQRALKQTQTRRPARKRLTPGAATVS